MLLVVQRVYCAHHAANASGALLDFLVGDPAIHLER